MPFAPRRCGVIPKPPKPCCFEMAQEGSASSPRQSSGARCLQPSRALWTGENHHSTQRGRLATSFDSRAWRVSQNFNFFFAQGNVCFGTYSPRSILFRGMRSPSSRPGPASALVQPGKGPGYRQSSRRSRRGLSVRKEWFSMVFRFSSIFPQHFSRPFFLFVRSMFVETHNLPSGGHCIDSDTG